MASRRPCSGGAGLEILFFECGFGLLESTHEIKQNKRRETLLNNKDKALISRKLVTLKHDAPIEIKLKD